MTEQQEQTLTEGDVIISPQGSRWRVQGAYGRRVHVVPDHLPETLFLERNELAGWAKAERPAPVPQAEAA